MFPNFWNLLSRSSALMLLLASPLAFWAQSRVQGAGQTSSLAGPADPQIVEALQDVSAQRIQSNIEKLVSFGTRLNLSAQDPAWIAAGRGIGAAREWIKSEFERYSKECGGCLEVKTDSFTEHPADRIPAPTARNNTYAVRKGTDPGRANRMELVIVRYDSQNSDTVDRNGVGSGADDDGR